MSPLRAGKDQDDPNSGTKPRLTKGNWNLALSPAKTKSQCVSRVVPPPIATPFTAAISGLSKFSNAFASRACGLSPGPGGCFRKSSMSLPAENESPAPSHNTTSTPSSFAASFRISAMLRYMLEVIAFFLAGRFNVTRKTAPERSVKISLIVHLTCASILDALLLCHSQESCRFVLCRIPVPGESLHCVRQFPARAWPPLCPHRVLELDY